MFLPLNSSLCFYISIYTTGSDLNVICVINMWIFIMKSERYNNVIVALNRMLTMATGDSRRWPWQQAVQDLWLVNRAHLTSFSDTAPFGKREQAHFFNKSLNLYTSSSLKLRLAYLISVLFNFTILREIAKRWEFSCNLNSFSGLLVLRALINLATVRPLPPLQISFDNPSIFDLRPAQVCSSTWQSALNYDMFSLQPDCRIRIR
jgi:hypothetical protein